MSNIISKIENIKLLTLRNENFFFPLENFCKNNLETDLRYPRYFNPKKDQIAIIYLNLLCCIYIEILFL